MRQADVETHNESGPYSPHRPAINVKMYHGSNTSPPDTEDVMEKFSCSKEAAERALQFSIDANREAFWEQAVFDAEFIFSSIGYKAKVYSAGRSGGWLVVEGLPDLEKWDAVMLGKWSMFTKNCRRAMEYLCSKESIFEGIESNRWAEEGAEKYNFYENEAGETLTISEMKKKAKEAGFGPVIRK